VPYSFEHGKAYIRGDLAVTHITVAVTIVLAESQTHQGRGFFGLKHAVSVDVHESHYFVDLIALP
jgi:hypothetical protein